MEDHFNALPFVLSICAYICPVFVPTFSILFYLPRLSSIFRYLCCTVFVFTFSLYLCLSLPSLSVCVLCVCVLCVCVLCLCVLCVCVLIFDSSLCFSFYLRILCHISVFISNLSAYHLTRNIKYPILGYEGVK